MFVTRQQKFILSIFVVVILLIPILAYLIQERASLRSKIEQLEIETGISNKIENPVNSQTNTKAQEELQALIEGSIPKSSPTPSPVLAQSTTIGPVLNFKINVEGRPSNDHSGRFFVGISEGLPVENPVYLMSFTVDVPTTGIFGGLSIAGLTEGTKYSTYIKAPAQIATAVTFTMISNTNYLNNNQTILLYSGDLNEDNTINSADYTLAKSSYGSKPASAEWNENADFNKDGVINNIDLAIILKNFGKVGNSGVWISPTPAPISNLNNNEFAPVGGVSTDSATTATPSAQPIPPPHNSTGKGYWIWVPME